MKNQIFQTMKTQTIILAATLSVLAFSCHKSDNDDCVVDNFSRNGATFYYAAIPDKYNSGCNETTSFQTLAESGNAGELFVNVGSNEKSGKYYTITSYSSNLTDLPKEVTVRDFDFSDADMNVVHPERFANNIKINFVNCKFKSFLNSKPYDDNKLSFSFDYCTFLGGVKEINITLNHCKIGGFIGDAMNPLSNFTCLNTFVCDLLPNANVTGTHIDGAQMYGREGFVGGNIKFNNVRFEFPSFHFEGYADGCNACIMFQLEFGDINNCTFENLICNGGGKWYPLYMTRGKFNQNNLVMRNVKVSDNFGTIFYPTTYDDKCKIENVEHSSDMYISSVFESGNKLHIICSNDSHLDKTLIIKTESREYTFNISHCPSNFALNGEIDTKVNAEESLTDSNGKSYSQYRYKDMPFDLDCPIDLTSGNIMCFDGEKMILEVKVGE